MHYLVGCLDHVRGMSSPSLGWIVGQVKYFDEDLVGAWAGQIIGLKLKGRVIALDDGVVKRWVGKNPLASLLAWHLSVSLLVRLLCVSE
jgi:hypothetical protein